jgi:putative aminopeptidase FrvX
MIMDLTVFLKELSAVPGVSGYEHSVRDLIRTAWTPLVSDVHIDPLGSLWAAKSGSGKAPRPKIMLAAHMDAIGMMVTQVAGEFLRVTSVGGLDARVLPGQLVTIHGRTAVAGVVVAPPAFLLPSEDREGVTPLTELLVDTGLPGDKLAEQVNVGDVISFAAPARELQNGLLCAKSLDNRAAVAAVTRCLEDLQGRTHVWDVVAVATSQEELGVRGARTSAFALRPDLAVAVDVTHGSGPAVKDLPDKTFAVGGGPTLVMGPNIHPGLFAAFTALADRLEIPYSVEVTPQHSGTDAFGIQVAREGIPTMVIGLPLRNMHTPVEVISPKDIERAGRLLAEFAAGLTAGFMDALTIDT